MDVVEKMCIRRLKQFGENHGKAMFFRTIVVHNCHTLTVTPSKRDVMLYERAQNIENVER